MTSPHLKGAAGQVTKYSGRLAWPELPVSFAGRVPYKDTMWKRASIGVFYDGNFLTNGCEASCGIISLL